MLKLVRKLENLSLVLYKIPLQGKVNAIFLNHYRYNCMWISNALYEQIYYHFLLFCFCNIFFANCVKKKEEDKTTERKEESFLNCYLVQINNGPEKSDEIIFEECIPCFVQTCNMPHL